MITRVEGAVQVQAYMGAFPALVDRSVVRAMNRAIRSGRALMVSLISADMGLKSSDVRDALNMYEASTSRPEATLSASLRRLPLIQFGARGLEPSKGKGRGVTYRLSGGKGRIENAFIATMRSGHRGVFKRIGKGRLPIRELKGPSIGRVFGKHRETVMEHAQGVFATNLEHELQYQESTGA